MNQQYQPPQVNEADWKLFRKRVPEWQQAFMDRLNQQYIQLLSGPETPADKFWKLERRIKRDKNLAGVIIDMRRSTMASNLIELIQEGAITLDDLDGFSEDLRGRLEFVFRDYNSKLEKKRCKDGRKDQ